MLQHAAVGVLRRDHLLYTSRARQHSGLSSQVTCFLLGISFGGIPSSALSLFARVLLRFTGRHRCATFVRYRTVKSCHMAQKRSTCKSHVNVSQRLRLLDNHLSRMTRTYTNWVVLALYDKGKWKQMMLFRESGKVLAGLDSLFLGHFGSNDC